MLNRKSFRMLGLTNESITREYEAKEAFRMLAFLEHIRISYRYEITVYN
jgi:hypothetical protein